jgi:hypothetical protein
MTSPLYSVFEGDGGVNAPKRPTALVDLGGLSFTDNIKFPPKDREHLSSSDFMQATRCEEAIARMIPVMRVELSLATGAVSVTSVVAVNSALTTTNVTVTETGSGLYTVQWPASMLPAANGRATATTTYSGQWLIAYAGTVSATSVELDIIDTAAAHSTALAYVTLLVY